MIPQWKIYPQSQGRSTVYLQNVVTDPSITVEGYTAVLVEISKGICYHRSDKK